MKNKNIKMVAFQSTYETIMKHENFKFRLVKHK